MNPESAAAICRNLGHAGIFASQGNCTDCNPAYVPDLDLDLRPHCTVCADGTTADTDGTSWWCAKCGTTWAMTGDQGERTT